MKRKTDDRKAEAKRAGGADRTKRTMLILTGVALVLILLVVLLLSGLLSGLSGADRGGKQALEDYLAERWTVFRLRAWDEENGALELDYPLRFSYAQMEKYGGRLEELQELPVGNLATAADLKTAAREQTGARIRSITVYGLTNDGQIAYTVYPDGSISACWEEPTAP